MWAVGWVVVVQICVFRGLVRVVDFGRLSRFLLVFGYRFWIVGFWQWFDCLLVMWFSWRMGLVCSMMP